MKNSINLIQISVECLINGIVHIGHRISRLKDVIEKLDDSVKGNNKYF